jgi:ketosteroid isomerase-like protein
MGMTPKGNNMKMASLFPKILLISVAMACRSGLAQAAPGPAAESRDASIEKTVREYYAAFEKKDWNMMQQILADGFTFSSPLDDHITVKAFEERCWPNAYKIKRFDLEKLVVNGDEAFVISNGWTTDGKLFRNSEYFRLKDGKIKEYECFFGRGISYPNSGK